MFAKTFHPILLLAVLLLGACADRGPQLTPLRSDAVILAFGDSLTYGSGAKAEESYPARLEQLSGRRVVNDGIPGEESDAGLARLPDSLAEFRPQLLLLCIGGNDMLRKRDLNKTKANLRRMVELARGEGIEVVLLGVPRPAIFGLDSAPFYDELAEEMGIAYIGELLPQVLAERELKADPIHPNASGYQQIARGIDTFLRERGAIY